MIVIGLRNDATQNSEHRMCSSIASLFRLTEDRKFCISSMHPAETFPFILSIGIVAQGLAFAGVQGTGLNSLFVKGCDTIGQFMWPGK